jgi:hypothetical protein
MKKDKISLNSLDNCLEYITYQRFGDKKELEEQLSKYIGFEINLQSKANLDTDYCFISNLHTRNKLIYLDIYYLIDLENNLYITGYSFDSDNALKDSDYNLKIMGNAK